MIILISSISTCIVSRHGAVLARFGLGAEMASSIESKTLNLHSFACLNAILNTSIGIPVNLISI